MDCRSNSWLLKLFVFLTLLPMLALASEAQTFKHTETTQKIYSLLTNKQFDDAFESAIENQTKLEGIVEFDLAFGIAARSTANCSQGLFALERVVQAQPQSIDGRFTLASCYYELGNFPAANTEFSILSQLKLSAELMQVVNQAIESIEKEKNCHQADGKTQCRLILEWTRIPITV